MKIRQKARCRSAWNFSPGFAAAPWPDDLATTRINLNLSPEHVIEEFEAKWWGDRFLRGRAVISGKMTFHIFCFCYARFSTDFVRFTSSTPTFDAGGLDGDF
jgi:hypothetical protein